MEGLDAKFTGVIHKVKDGSSVPPDEWMVFLVQDATLVPMLEFYRSLCLGEEPDLRTGVMDGLMCAALARAAALSEDVRQAQAAAMDRCIDRVKIWQAAHPERVKIPDVLPDERLQG